MPRAGQGARDMPPREEGPGQGSAHCSPGLKARTPVCNLGGIPCKSSIARGSKAFPAAQTPPLQNSHPDSPFLFSKEPLSQAQPLQPEVHFRSLCQARPPGTPDPPHCCYFGWTGPPCFHSPQSRDGGPFPTVWFAQAGKALGAIQTLLALLLGREGGNHKSQHLRKQTEEIDSAINVSFPLPPAIAGLIPAQHEKHVLTCWPGDLPTKRFKSSPGAQILQGDSFLLGNAAHTAAPDMNNSAPLGALDLYNPHLWAGTEPTL